VVVAGIDYSMTSPAICIHDGDEWYYDNCKFFYIVNKEKLLIEKDQYKSCLYPEWDTNIQRFDNLGSWSINILTSHNVDVVYIEGYAFGASGLVFNMAENGGILKHKIWMSGIPMDVVPPTTIKKFATGKGNANKEKMHASFIEETGVDVRKAIDIPNKSWNPVSDIVDAYYIAKYAFAQKVK
jgi:Holliday junction resolvasome RuvABC endonuclease subunit